MTVGRQRNVSGIDTSIQRRHHGNGGIVKAAACTCCDIHVTARFGKFHRGVKDVADATAVRRTDVLDGEALSDDVFVHVERARDIARVNVQETDLARDHTCHADFS